MVLSCLVANLYSNTDTTFADRRTPSTHPIATYGLPRNDLAAPLPIRTPIPDVASSAPLLALHILLPLAVPGVATTAR